MKKVLITGASSGIGLELAKIFATKNHALYLVARDVKNLKKIQSEIKNKYPDAVCHIFSIDLSNQTKIMNLILNIKNRFGKLDIVINNAGTLIKKNFTKITQKDLYYSFSVNFFSPFILTQKMMSILSKKAHIVFISSIGGLNGSSKFPGLSSYSSSKGALITLTECLAEEFKMTDLKFNCLALGAVQTKMLKKAFPGYKAPTSAKEMALFIFDFSINGGEYFNGKVIPVSLSTP